MRNIRKRPEPASLTQYRSSSQGSYEDYRHKGDLQQALVAEQRGLCCYCLSRIAPEWGKMRIEHWRSQSEYPEQALDYANLLGACVGGERGHERHCDVAKGNASLSRNPADPQQDVEALIEYKDDGRIYSRDTEFNEELNKVLNLNVASLRNNREDTLTGFLRSLPAKGRWDRQRLLRERKYWNGDSHNDHLEPFCQVVVYWLDRRLGRLRGAG